MKQTKRRDKMEQITAYYLENRAEVLRKAVEMAQNANTHLYGMGRDLSWLSDPEFRNAVCSRTTLREGGGLDMLVIAARRDHTAKEYARSFYDEIKAEVGFLSFGQARVVVSDGESLLLGFPVAPGLREEVNEVGFGLYIEHPRLARWLEERFLNKYKKCSKLGQNAFQSLCTWIMTNKEQVIFTTALSLASFIAGLLIRALLKI
jgi:hypothetical protein